MDITFDGYIYIYNIQFLDLHLVQKKVYLFISARFGFFCSVQGVQKKNARYVLYQ